MLTGVRRCGKSTLQAQLMRRTSRPFYCNVEDTRLFGMGPADSPAFLTVLDDVATPRSAVFLDEVNASLLGKDLGSKLTGRHVSFEVFPFSYAEFLAFTGRDRGAASFGAFLDDGAASSQGQAALARLLVRRSDLDLAQGQVARASAAQTGPSPWN